MEGKILGIPLPLLAVWAAIILPMALGFAAVNANLVKVRATVLSASPLVFSSCPTVEGPTGVTGVEKTVIPSVKLKTVIGPSATPSSE